MKFNKYLREHAIPAWVDMYISYKRLKRIIKKRVLQIQQLRERFDIETYQPQPQQQSHHDNPQDPNTTLSFQQSPKTLSNKFLQTTHYDTFMMLNENQFKHQQTHQITTPLLENTEARTEFFAVLKNEMEKVEIMFVQKMDEMKMRAEMARGDTKQTENNDIETANETTNRQRKIIGAGQQKIYEERIAKCLDIYRLGLQLQSFSELNYMGFSKILKKYDKNAEEDTRDTIMQRIDTMKFRTMLKTELHTIMKATEEMYIRTALAKDMDIGNVMQVLNNLRKEVSSPQTDEQDAGLFRPAWIIVSILSGLFSAMLPILPHHEPRAHKCLGMLVYITILWITEAVPFYVASVSIPLLVVLLGILVDADGVVLNAERASKVAFGSMFSDTVMLILGGFALSAAFSKCQFELRIASIVQQWFGDRPKVFLLAFMLLGTSLSMLISNVAAPVLLTTIILPIVRDLSRSSPYARTLLLGLAISGNIGGMTSPIASPQNAIALGFLESSDPDQAISFTEWLYVSVPFCTLAVVVAWAYLVLSLLTDENSVPSCIPEIVYEREKFSKVHWTVLIVGALTVGLWCSLGFTRPLFGDMGTIAVIPFIAFFGTGILTKNDLLGFSWNLILLIGGGSVLGTAVNSSQLLHIISNAIAPYLSGSSFYITTLAVLALVFIVATFVSHTVASLILTPLIISIGEDAGSARVLVMCATLTMSATMLLPMSSFPNVNCLLVDDDFNRPFLHPVDFLRHGTPVSLGMLLLIVTVGYGLSVCVLG